MVGLHDFLNPYDIPPRSYNVRFFEKSVNRRMLN
nr:MAG TPA: hypothetical protein [Caudoviricetes sp.]